MQTENEVLEFISKFKKIYPAIIEELFFNEYCYYFAVMLKERFGGTVMVRDDRFSCLIDVGGQKEIKMRCFNIMGKVSGAEFVTLEEYKKLEPYRHKRLMQHYFRKE